MSENAWECFWRNWQHGKLWINHPDCIVLQDIDRELIRVDGTIEKITQSVTEDASFCVGRTFIENETKTVKVISIFNWENQEKDIEIYIQLPCTIMDFWTGEKLEFETNENKIIVRGLKPHSGKVVECNYI